MYGTGSRVHITFIYFTKKEKCEEGLLLRGNNTIKIFYYSFQPFGKNGCLDGENVSNNGSQLGVVHCLKARKSRESIIRLKNNQLHIMQKPTKNTKRLFPFALAGALMLMSMGCGEDDTQLNCETTYDNTKIVEVLNNVTAKVIDFNFSGIYVLTIDSLSLSSSGYIIGSDNILVPCNDMPENLKVNEMIVIVSGNKLNYCNQLTLPMLRRGFGCKFEITSIKALTDK
jgi:hypothetical protein